jgi:hypothetical protein
MKDEQLLQRLFPNLPSSILVIGVNKDGLSLSDGSALHWPEEETGVVLASDFEGDIVGECWPGDEGHDDLLRLFERHRGPQEIQDRPRLRVIWGDEVEQ